MSIKIAAVRSRSSFRKIGFIAVVTMMCLMFASCASKGKMRHKALDEKFDEGNFLSIADDIKKNGKKMYGDNGEFLFHMDLGVLYHYAGEYEQSNTHLNKAEEIYHDLFTRSVTNEALALLTNDNARPYRAKPYELALLHQFAMLNFMALGNFDGAQVEVRKAQILFNEWERTRAASGKFHDDGISHLLASLAYEGTPGEEDNAQISLFKAVAAFKRGPVKLPSEVAGFAHDRFMAGDRADDVSKLGVSPNNSGNKWDAKMGQAEIVVVGYSGRGPSMYENNYHGSYVQSGILRIYGTTKSGNKVTLELPAPPLPADSDGRPRSVGNKVDIKISLPEMVNYGSSTDHFIARADGAGEARSVVVSDLELQAKKELDDSWGEIIARTVVRTIIRTLAANEVKNRINTGNPLLNMAASISTDVATDQMEKADIRMCFMIPQKIQIVRIPVEPGTHNVSLSAFDRHGREIDSKTFNGVQVKRGEKKVLLYNSFK